MSTETKTRASHPIRETAVIRFAGDSGDGMQLTGSQFTLEAALSGRDVATFPDYPAEIRAPAGTTYGVSAFQIHFGEDVMTSGDELDVLVALNPAALKVNLEDLVQGGTIVVDKETFTKHNLQKANYESNPLEDGSLDGYRVLDLEISKMTLGALEEFELSKKEALRSRNMWTLGLMLWMYGRDREATVNWLRTKFADQPEIAEANVKALNAGHAFGETAELSRDLPIYTVAEADLEPGEYRAISGTEALGLGLVAGLRATGLPKLVFGSYPITPASPLLHVLARYKDHGVITFQAEDEIAAVCSAIGASYGGALGVTSSSGPGIALKGEAIGLAVAVELPLIVVNSQRAGPSTGMPTKTEQSDLFQALYGRNADAPLAVVAAASPADCFEVAIEAARIATKFMTPVMLLSDGYLANASEPWRIPQVEELPRFPVSFRTDGEGYQPFIRDPETLARAWAVPGTPGLEHRIGGLERNADTGNISYDPENHQRMTEIRMEKIANIANDIPEQEVELGETTGELAVVGWGSTYGSIHQAVRKARGEGARVSQIHIRHLWPLPRNLGELLGGFDRILVPEMNAGQLLHVLRSQYLLTAEGLNKVAGKPFKISEVLEAIRERTS